LLLLEFGIPHYRIFIYQYFQEIFKEFKIIHSGEIFDINNDVFRNFLIFSKLKTTTLLFQH